jgi:hypothetical protein
MYMGEGVATNETNVLSLTEINNPNKLTPEQVLIELARVSQPKPGDYSEQVSGGFFPNVGEGYNKIVIDKDGNVLLKRYVDRIEYLTKEGKDETPKEMMSSSLYSGSPGGGSVHTSANIEGWYSHRPIYGIFKIPVKDFLENANNGKLILGNLGESEVVITGVLAEKYLDKVYENESYIEEKHKLIDGGELPQEININI